MNSDKRIETAITINELIPSKDVEEYSEEQGCVFTDSVKEIYLSAWDY